MLCQFTFQNFNSYRDEAVFDFQADNLPEFPDSLIQSPGGSPLLPVSVVYGPNGGGKTNLLKALSCVISLVVRPILDLGKNRVSEIFQQNISYSPFAFDTRSSSKPTEFSLFFRTSANEFHYSVSLLKNEVQAESLYRKTIRGKRTATIFERDGASIKLGSSINRSRINRNVNPKMPFLSFLAINYDLPVITEAQSWFESCIIRSYANPQTEMGFLLPGGEGEDLSSRSLIAALNSMGIDVSGYRFDPEQNRLFLQHTIDDQIFELPFEAESDGTRKIFSSLPVILIALSEGRLAIVDELDSKLHPILLRYLISLFTNPRINKHGAQLLFTSHDMSTLNHRMFRRDEIWFAALNQQHSSELYSLVEIRTENGQMINQTAAFDKQYLEGRYGADPYLRAILDWEAIG